VRLLGHGATVTFLLRSVSVFDNDEIIKSYVSSGKARLVQGDALIAEDVANAWAKAAEGENTSGVDFVLFTVGGTGTISLRKGAIIDPPNLCTQCALNVLCTMPTFQTQPKFIFISSIGTSKASHANLPVLLKPFYSWMLANPHADKLGSERVVHYCAGKEWVDPEPSAELMNAGETEWQAREGLPGQGELKDWVIVRPALFTDGECKADDEGKKKGKKSTASKPPYKVVDGDAGAGYTISRRDVAHFLVEGVIMNWDTWQGKIVGISY
jgi:hypothetical protein